MPPLLFGLLFLAAGACVGQGGPVLKRVGTAIFAAFAIATTLFALAMIAGSFGLLGAGTTGGSVFGGAALLFGGFVMLFALMFWGITFKALAEVRGVREGLPDPPFDYAAFDADLDRALEKPETGPRAAPEDSDE